MKKALPQILVVDDFYGTNWSGRNRDRENFCFRSGILDITGDIESEQLESPVSEGVFFSGQKIFGDKIENDLEGTMAVICQGFTVAKRWSLVLLDLHFKTGPLHGGEAAGRDEDRDPLHYFGLKILKAIRNDEALADLPVIILSSMDRAEAEPIFSGLSALDFCDKTRLDRNKVQSLLHEHGLIEDETIIGRSLPLLKCLREARKRAGHGNDNILIVGESGTGKELLANYIHRKSGRNGAYVPLFTQGVPDTLIEDRLFGHEKGAFAGAATSAHGAAEQADKGTLFIDEFGDIPSLVQAKLLRLLDPNTRESQRLGAAKPRTLDLQIVMATSRLSVLRGEDFRGDLLYRAKAADPVTLPPLRERPDDIPLLTEYFLRKLEARFGAERRVIPQETMDTLLAQNWPGNVRDLERVIEHGVLHYKGLRILLPQHLKLGIAASPEQPLAGRDESISGPEPVGTTVTTSKATGEELQRLLRMLSEFPYDHLSSAELVGSYDVAREATLRCMAGLLRQALVVTSRPTAGNPSGEIYYTPAVHLLLGIQEQEKIKWRSPKCADLVRQIVGASEELKEEFLADEILRAAYEAATRLRQRK